MLLAKMKPFILCVLPLLANIATGFEWVQQDCYGDKTYDRRLKLYYKSTGINPPNPSEVNLKAAFDSCKAGAEEKNYDYFGIQNTYECWGEIGQPDFKKFGKVDRCATGKDGYKIGLKDANAVYAIKVDGGLSKWSEWSHCRHTCGDSIQKRFRTCTNPKPRGVGKDCEGTSTREESRKCALPPCNVDGGFSFWTDWTKCTKTCGDATRSRSRSCTNPPPVGNGKKCKGATTETKSCGLPKCLVNGWVALDCFKDEVASRRLRNYYKSTGIAWPANPTQADLKPMYESCKAGAEERGYDYFGIQFKEECWGDMDGERYDDFGKAKPEKYFKGKDGYKVGGRSVNCVYAIQVDGAWTKWTEWSVCDKTCGAGVRIRSRSCTNPKPRGLGKKCPGHASETKACTKPPCTDEKWVMLDCYKDKVSSRRLRYYYKATGIAWPENPSQADLKPMYESCKAGAEERKFDYFGIQFKKECWGDDINADYKKFGKEPKFFTGKDGFKVGDRDTNCVYAAKVDCGFSKWSDWSACTKTCGPASKSRTRTATNPPQRGIGKKCVGPLRETKACNQADCDEKWVRLGCWKDVVGARALPHFYQMTGVPYPEPESEHNLKPIYDSCKAGAEKKDYCYFGLQYKKECWGGGEGAPYKKYGAVKTFGTGKDGYSVGYANTNCVWGKKIDGGWTEWTAFTACDKTCGVGVRKRTRKCTNPPRSCMGAECPGSNTESKTCTLPACKNDKWVALECYKDKPSDRRLPHFMGLTGIAYPKIDALANLKPMYEACKKLAEANGYPFFGIQYRKECWGGPQESEYTKFGPTEHFGLGKDGYKVGYEDTNCVYAKKIDGNWSPWTQWSGCGKTCGEAFSIRKRSRGCSDPVPQGVGKACEGPSEEKKPCNLPACPDDGGWGNFTDWSKDCTKTCGGGIQYRTKCCDNPLPASTGKTCSGLGVETRACNTEKCPGYKPWGDWGPCSVTCGAGVQERSRECTRPDKDCSSFGPAKQTKKCVKDPCATDGGYSKWTPWGECSVTCGNGVVKRTRTCSNPPPKEGGKDCSSLGPAEETKVCNKPACGVDGGYTKWGDWGDCSVTCGEGVQVRKRACDNPKPAHGGKNCDGLGPAQETKKCTKPACPIDGGYKPWGDWGDCSVTCGEGVQVRKRSCDNPKPANGGKNCDHLGASQETKKCTKPACPIDGGYKPWGDWGDCSVTCGEGVQVRKRSCDNPKPANGGKNCDHLGASQETKKCTKPACPIDGGYKPWGDWGDCSVTCGEGVQVRKRTCDNPKPANGGKNCDHLGASQETKKCTKPACPIDGGYKPWGDWGDCSVTCGEGVQVRKRTCDNPKPANGGKNCDHLGASQETKKCTKPACPIDGGYSNWGNWGDCSVTCGNGVQVRKRTCNNPAPANGGKDCSQLGSAKETKECRKDPCSIDGGYTPWSNWEKCTVTCGYGVTSRKRTCTKPPPAGNGKDCSGLGPAIETKECNTDLCPSPCKNPKIFDLGILVDSSQSIGEENFVLIRSFLVKLIDQFDVGPSETRIGIIQYNHGPQYRGLTPKSPANQNKAYLQDFAKKLPYLKGKTRTDIALQLAYIKFFAGAERSYPNVLIVLTDGNTDPGSKPYSQILPLFKKANVRIIAVGVGKEIDNAELHEIAMGDTKHVIHIDDFRQLIRNMNELLDKACKKT